MIFKSQETVYKNIAHFFNVFKNSEGRIRSHFHLTGPSGSGKSYLVDKIAKEMKLPIIEVNTAGITAEGLSGNSLTKALRKLREQWNGPTIIFVDGFDKLFQRNGETTEGFRSDVQDGFLTALESKYTSIFTDYGKYEPAVIENSLFIFAGAYSNQKIETIQELVDVGMRKEFVGRVPLVLSTQDVSIGEILDSIPNTTLFKEYLKVFPTLKAAIALKGIRNIILEQQDELKLGIRIVNSATHQYFMNRFA